VFREQLSARAQSLPINGQFKENPKFNNYSSESLPYLNGTNQVIYNGTPTKSVRFDPNLGIHPLPPKGQQFIINNNPVRYLSQPPPQHSLPIIPRQVFNGPPLVQNTNLTSGLRPVNISYNPQLRHYELPPKEIHQTIDLRSQQPPQYITPQPPPPPPPQQQQQIVYAQPPPQINVLPMVGYQQSQIPYIGQPIINQPFQMILPNQSYQTQYAFMPPRM
jgi:hypothetical protein